MDALDVIGSQSRWRLLELLAEGDRSVGELAEELHISNQGALKHLSVLMEAGLVKEMRPSGGRKVSYALRNTVFLFRREDDEGDLLVYYRGRSKPGRLSPETRFRAGRLLKRFKMLLDKPF